MLTFKTFYHFWRIFKNVMHFVSEQRISVLHAIRDSLFKKDKEILVFMHSDACACVSSSTRNQYYSFFLYLHGFMAPLRNMYRTLCLRIIIGCFRYLHILRATKKSVARAPCWLICSKWPWRRQGKWYFQLPWKQQNFDHSRTLMTWNEVVMSLIVRRQI